MPRWPVTRRQPTPQPISSTPPQATPNEPGSLVILRTVVLLLIGILTAAGTAIAAVYSGCTLIETLGWAGATFAATIGFLKTIIK